MIQSEGRARSDERRWKRLTTVVGTGSVDRLRTATTEEAVVWDICVSDSEGCR